MTNKMTRRTFIKGGAILGASSILGSGAWGIMNKPSFAAPTLNIHLFGEN